LPPDPLVLGFDTSAAHCAAALLRGPKILAMRQEDMAKGQAERLMPLLEEVLAEGGARWRDLAAIGVGTGPGNFTGIRISVSAARGLALALGIPAIGVSGFETLTCNRAGPFMAVVAAPRQMVFTQLRDVEPGAPQIVPEAVLANLGMPIRRLSDLAPARQAVRIAEIAGQRYHDPQARPAPLYVRAPDAAPPRDPAPVLLP